MHRTVLHETNAVYAAIASLRTEVVENQMMIDALENKMNKNLKIQKIDADTKQELVYANSQLIVKLDAGQSALENTEAKAGSSGGNS